MENVLVYVPLKYRIKNIRASCVHASVTVSMRNANLWQEADRYWNTYKGDLNGENARSISAKLDKFGVKYIIVDEEQHLLEALQHGRTPAATCFGAHCISLVGYIDDKAYIIDNEQIERYRILPWNEFLRKWRASGGWAVVILGGKVRAPQDSQIIPN